MGNNSENTTAYSETRTDAEFLVFRFLLERGYDGSRAARRARFLSDNLGEDALSTMRLSGGDSQQTAKVLADIGALEANQPATRRVGDGRAYDLFQRSGVPPRIMGLSVTHDAFISGGRGLPTLHRVGGGGNLVGLIQLAPPVVAAAETTAATSTTAAGGGLTLGKAAGAAGGLLVSKEGLEALKSARKAQVWPTIEKKTNNIESRHSVDLTVGDDHPPDILEVSSEAVCTDGKLELVIKVKARDPDTWGNDTGIDLIEVWAKDLDCGAARKTTEVVEEGASDTFEGNAGKVIEREIRIRVNCANAFKGSNGDLKFAFAVRVKDHNGNSTTLNGICTDGVKGALAKCCPPSETATPASSGAGASGGGGSTAPVGSGSTAPVDSGSTAPVDSGN